MSALEINMSLAKIEKLGVPIPNIGRETERTALAFALDSAYLMPFKAMVFSMARTGTMLDSPLYVLSDDPSLFDDGVVKLVADKVVLIEGELRDHLYNLAAHNVGRPERATWNRGTCLKWAVFDDYDVEQVLLPRRRHAVFGTSPAAAPDVSGLRHGRVSSVSARALRRPTARLTRLAARAPERHDHRAVKALHGTREQWGNAN